MVGVKFSYYYYVEFFKFLGDCCIVEIGVVLFMDFVWLFYCKCNFNFFFVVDDLVLELL